MISKTDLQKIYQWGLKTKFPLKLAPTTKGYTNKDIFICGLKFVRKNVNIRKNLMDEDVYNILKDDDILYATYTIFQEGTVLTPHLDPNVYRDRYKRVQIPLRIPDKEKCYMVWEDGKKIFWQEGEPQVHYIMDHFHEGYNYSDDAMIFLMLDIKKSTEVKL